LDISNREIMKKHDRFNQSYLHKKSKTVFYLNVFIEKKKKKKTRESGYILHSVLC